MEKVCTATYCGRSPRRLNRAGRLLGNFEYQRTHFHGDVDDGVNVYVAIVPKIQGAGNIFCKTSDVGWNLENMQMKLNVAVFNISTLKINLAL